MTRAARLFPVVLAALVLAGCSQGDNTPESYPDRTKPADQQDGNDYEVWNNFRDACTEANADLDDDVALDVCECTWDAYVEDVPFEVFLDFDQTIRERIGDIGDNSEDLEIIANNVVADYNASLGADEEPLDVDLIALMESCEPQSA